MPAIIFCMCLAVAVGARQIAAQAAMAAKSAQTAQPWRDQSLSPDKRADLLVSRMTLDEKIQLLHGYSVTSDQPQPKGSLHGDGFVPGIPRLGIPDLQLIGSGMGVTNLGRRKNGQSTALPSALADAATWSPELACEFGSVIGRETREEGFNVALGGGIDLAREPRGGRTFEYHGEDPILAGTITAAELRGTQDQGVVATIKHFAMNDQESGRSSLSANISRRAMRETDLLAFEIGLKDSHAGAVMCAYNRVNGVYSCENSYLLNDVLKLDWGFPGWVMTDWGAHMSTVESALSGADQEFFSGRYYADALKHAVEQGDVPEPVLDNMVHRILRTLFAVGVFDHPPVIQPIDFQADAAVAQRIAEAGSVLLRNAHGALPLDASRIHTIAVIGGHADAGVMSGGGSGQVRPVGGNAVPPPPGTDPGDFYRYPVWDPSSPLRAIRALAPQARVQYDPGTDLASAARIAARSEVAIVFVSQWMHENRDLADLSLPGNQDELIRRVAAANPHTIVVLETGGPVLMPWLQHVGGVLEAWYPGERGGEAVARILFGAVDPSGRLPVTFPRSEADLPHPKIRKPPPGGGYFDVDYTEGLKVGYKWYDAMRLEPLFPFGYGLSYTTFAFSNLRLTPEAADGSRKVEVSFDLENTGQRAGSEVAQVYLSLPGVAGEPPRRLVGWVKADLAPHVRRSFTVTLDPAASSHPLSFWNPEKNTWDTAPGEYQVYVGGSSRDLPLTGAFRVAQSPRDALSPAR